MSFRLASVVLLSIVLGCGSSSDPEVDAGVADGALSDPGVDASLPDADAADTGPADTGGADAGCADADGDDVCDDDDVCPGFDDAIDVDSDGVPDGCDVCRGDDASGDADSDGVCDDIDACPGFDDAVDADSDGVPDDCDECRGDDASGDADSDDVCDDIDACPGFDDALDGDSDGAPDGCDVCRGDDASGDSDLDEVCDELDVCPGFDDALDADMDGSPDGCDVCRGDDASGDSDADAVCDDIDVCPGGDGTLLFETFESGAGSFTLNTGDFDGTTTDHSFVVNNAYAGGRGSFICFGIPYSVTAPPTPTQPVGVQNGPTSSYMHIASNALVASGVLSASYLPPVGSCVRQGSHFASTSDVDVTGMEEVELSFYWLNEGSPQARGQVYYSENGGTSWVQLVPAQVFHSQSTWTTSSARIPTRTSTIRLGFRFLNETGGPGDGPAFSVDDVRLECVQP